MQLANAPRSTGYMRLAYNVLMDMDNPWLKRDEIYDLLPKEARVRNAKKKLNSALNNGVRAGVFVFVNTDEMVRGNVVRKFRIATADHREAQRGRYQRKNTEYQRTRKAKKKAAKTVRKTPVKRERNAMVRAIDVEIADLEKRLAILNRMRRDAMKLGT